MVVKASFLGSISQKNGVTRHLRPKKLPLCTLYAISLAKSKACDDLGVQIISEDVRKLLVFYDDIFDNLNKELFPEEFNWKIRSFITEILMLKNIVAIRSKWTAWLFRDIDKE